MREDRGLIGVREDRGLIGVRETERGQRVSGVWEGELPVVEGGIG